MQPPQPLPSRRSRIEPFLVMDVMEEARCVELAGARVLHLEVGQPGTGAPKAVIDAAHAALDRDALGYSVAQGDAALRLRIQQHYQMTHRKGPALDDILVTQGASGAFILCFLAAFDAGDEVVVTRPGYPCYRHILSALDLRVIQVGVDQSTGYQLTVEHLKRLDRLPRGVVVASPANPTGSVLGPKELGELVRFCEERQIVLIVDEIYHGLSYTEQPAVSATGLGEGVFVINSFSKYFSMTGWRLGWMVSPPAYRRNLEILAQNFVICAPTLAQRAALAAFDARDELDGHVARYRKNRDVLIDALVHAGVTRRAPADGAFYVYADFSDFTSDTRQFCRRMLRDILVAATPGVDFDPVDGHKMIRFSYCGETAQVTEAAERIAGYLKACPRA